MTDSFRSIQPSPQLSPYVKQYWFLKSSCTGHVQGIIPTGYVSVFFQKENPLFCVERNELYSQAYVGGQSTTYSNLLLTGTIDMVCIDFLPYGAKMFFDLPVNKLKDDTVSLELLEEPGWNELGKRLTDIADPESSVRLIEQFLLRRFSYANEYNMKRMVTAVANINNGQWDIGRLSDESCLGYKQFKRVFSEYIGINPKDFLRIVRFQKALFTLQTHPEISLTQLACACDFYDQSHLIKEFKSFSGYTPGEYIAICPPVSDYFS